MSGSRRITVVAAIALILGGVTAPAGQAKEFQKVQFRNVDSGKVLWTALSYGPARVADAIGVLSEKWELVPSLRGYLIRNAYSKACLQAPRVLGEAITMEPCNDQVPTQEWGLDSAGDKITITEIADRKYVIEEMARESCPVPGPPEDCAAKRFVTGHPLQLWDVLPA
ncbi:RICIN domain-containing protein [Kitasatospora sp. NPDC058115]|uniref:RICIN domain-containing protein n=1 Tax=Kitasatospora sp. NPDC058115 TaxID=3346347 RepID=UPI0036DF0B74